jgi:3',5'-cyclic AMP phosphodiesterase CpdA
VHLSDLHLTSLESVSWRCLPGKRFLGYLSWCRKRRFEHAAHVIEGLMERLRELDPAQYLVTGDLTHIGLPDEFLQAAGWLESLGGPDRVALVPGNHDGYAPESWVDTYGCWSDYLAGDRPHSSDETCYPSLRVRGQVAFIGLSSAVPTPPLMATGTLGHSQLKQLGHLLTETGRRGLFRVLYLHHPPLHRGEKWRKRLVDAPELETLIARAGVELILHGHSHRNIDREIRAAGRSVPVVGVASASAAGYHGECASFGAYQVEDSVDSGWCLKRTLWQWDELSGDFAVAGHRDWLIPPG